MSAARWLVASALLVVVPLTVVRVAGLDRGFPAVALMTVYPYVVALAALALLGALLLRWPAGTIVAGAVLVIGVALLAPRALPDRTVTTTDPDGPLLVVAVLNLAEGRADATTVVEVVDAEAVDVLIALEVTDASVDALAGAGLGASLPNAEVLPSRFTSGGGIWSRHALEAREPSRLRGFGATPRATIEVPGHGPLMIDAVHPLPPISAVWTRSWQQVLAALPDAEPDAGTGAGIDTRRILVGDFNATLDHRALRDVLARGWVDAAAARGAGLRSTFNGLPVGEPVPPVTLDHVLVDEQVLVEQVRTRPVPGTDHRLLLARLRLPAQHHRR